MAKKTQQDTQLADLRKAQEEGKVLFGAKQAMKSLRNSLASHIYIAKNTPEYVKEDIQHYGELANTPVTELSMNNKELGVAAKKMFVVSVLTIIK